jgi:hypothetical protein
VSTEEEIKKQGFTFVDKRGQNNPIQEKPKPIEESEDTRPVKDRRWKSIAYVIAINQASDGSPIVLGKAFGLADDQNIFFADYLFGMRWEAGFDWTIDAKRRLDTFLQCTCDQKTGPCKYHRRMTNGGWLKEDHDRIREDGDRAVPEVLEILSKANKTRVQAQQVLAPRR